MKKEKKLNVTLKLNKTTIVKLNQQEMNNLNGGDHLTDNTLGSLVDTNLLTDGAGGCTGKPTTLCLPWTLTA